MDSVLALLILASMICLVLGLIKPTLFKGLFKGKTSRLTVGLTFGLIMIASFTVFGIVTERPLSDAEKAKADIDLAIEEMDKGEMETSKDNKKNKNTETPASLTPEEAIKNIINKELKGNNNKSKPYIRGINLSMDNNEASVIISYNADDNLTVNLALTGIKGKMSELYSKLYRSNSPIKSVSVCAYMTLTDKYGNESDDIVYTTVLGKAEAAKVNWNADDAVLKYSILPKVWTNNYLHPALSEEE
jgi:hypothetical protein